MDDITQTSNTFNLQVRQITPELISSVTDRIIYGVRPSQIHLFGSQANGQANVESDLDLLVIVDTQHALAPLQHRFRAGKILDLFRYRRFGLDTIVLTEEEIQLLQAENEGEWDLILDILATGKLLYERHKETQD